MQDNKGNAIGDVIKKYGGLLEIMGNYENQNLSDDGNSSWKKYIKADLYIIGLLFKTFVYPILIAAFVLFTLGLISVLDFNNMKERCTESVTAIVISNTESLYAKKGRYKKEKIYKYAPVYTYVYNGQVYSCESDNSTRPAMYDVGDTAVIKVNPDNPAEIYEPDFTNVRVKAVIFVIVGGVGILACICVIVANIYNKKKQQNSTDVYLS